MTLYDDAVMVAKATMLRNIRFLTWAARRRFGVLHRRNGMENFK